MKIKKTIIIPLFLLILVVSFLRLFHLSWQDAYTNEVLVGFRAIGLIDYVATLDQTTPWEWLSVVPAWVKLSFHDHPMLLSRIGLQDGFVLYYF